MKVTPEQKEALKRLFDHFDLEAGWPHCLVSVQGTWHYGPVTEELQEILLDLTLLFNEELKDGENEVSGPDDLA